MSGIDNPNIFRPIIEQIPGQPDPTSGDAADLAGGFVTMVCCGRRYDDVPASIGHACSGAPEPRFARPLFPRTPAQIEAAGATPDEAARTAQGETWLYSHGCRRGSDALIAAAILVDEIDAHRENFRLDGIDLPMTDDELRAWFSARGVPARDVQLYVGQNRGSTRTEMEAIYARFHGSMA